jgi:hypothetical protein
MSGEAATAQRSTAFDRLAASTHRSSRPLNAAVPIIHNNIERQRIQEAVAREMRARHNPFLQREDEHGFYLPPDDETYHYAMIRVTRSGATDKENLMAIMNGQLSYEPVPLNDLPKGSVERLVAMSIKDGDWKGYLGTNDVLLMRCSQRMYRHRLDAWDTKSDRAIMDTNAGFEAEARSRGIEPFAEFDQKDEPMEGPPGRMVID